MQVAVELRSLIARALQGRAAAIVTEAIGGYPFVGIEHIIADDRTQIGDLAFELLATAVRDGELDAGYTLVGNLGRLAADKDVSIRLLINARHGHGAADRVIERVGIVVRNYFRETDWVARVGGDAFGVLLPEIQGFNAERLAQRIRTTVQERLQLHDHRSDEDYQVTVSVGVVVAETVDRSVQAEQLLTDAEAAVDRAKQAGRTRVERVNASVGGPPASSRAIQID